VRQREEATSGVLASVETLRAASASIDFDAAALRSMLLSMLPEDADRFAPSTMMLTDAQRSELQAV
jgi:hypothetical protein